MGIGIAGEAVDKCPEAQVEEANNIELCGSIRNDANNGRQQPDLRSSLTLVPCSKPKSS